MMSAQSIQEKEQQILLAAMHEFNNKGVHGARMQEIADRAGVNKALVHYYFRSKDNLYLKVLEQIVLPFWETLERKIGALDDQEDFATVVRIIATTVVESSLELPYVRILLIEFASGGQYLAQMDRLMQHALHSANKTVLGYFSRLIERGVLKPFNPLIIFTNIIGMCWNIFLAEPFTTPVLEQMQLARDDNYYAECIESIVEMASAGLCRTPNDHKEHP